MKDGTATSMSASHKNRIYQLKVVPNLEFGFVNVYAFEVTELEQAKSRAQKAERAKADFLSMSHEIRTPLNAILGLNEVMLLDNPDAEQQRQIEIHPVFWPAAPDLGQRHPELGGIACE